MKVCPSCGLEMSDTARFCRKCGTRMEGIEPVQEAVKKEAADDEAVVPETSEIAETKMHEEPAVQPSEAIEAGDSDEAVTDLDDLKDIPSVEEAEETEPAFEEPRVSEDGSLDFNWDQPVKIDEREPKRSYDLDQTEKTDEFDEGRSYEWGPPTASAGRETAELMPVRISGQEEGYGEDEYEEEFRAYGSSDGWDHTAEFDAEDISENKVMAMAAYLLGPLGVIIALMAAKTSPYAGFHARQGLKLVIMDAVVSVITVLLCWTVIVAAAGVVFLVILLVLKIIAFVSVCKGKAVDLPILRGMKFLK